LPRSASTAPRDAAAQGVWPGRVTLARCAQRPAFWDVVARTLSLEPTKALCVMRARSGDFQLLAGWLPEGFDAGAGRIEYGASPFVAEDGSSRPPPSVADLVVRRDVAKDRAATHTATRRVLFNLDFFGPDLRNHCIEVLAMSVEPGRFERYQPPWWPHVRIGDRDVALAAADPDSQVPGAVGHQALWVERAADISVVARGIELSDLFRFIEGLRPAAGSDNSSR